MPAVSTALPGGAGPAEGGGGQGGTHSTQAVLLWVPWGGGGRGVGELQAWGWGCSDLLAGMPLPPFLLAATVGEGGAPMFTGVTVALTMAKC